MPDLSTNLSEHFTLRELLRSDTASLNHYDEQFTPSQEVIDNLKSLCVNLLEPLRAKISEHMGKDTAIHITSGYRCLRLNQAVGGVVNSQHLTGEAADTHVDGMSIQDWYDFVKHSGVSFDQVIREYSQWAHLSSTKNNRNECWIYERGMLPKKDS